MNREKIFEFLGFTFFLVVFIGCCALLIASLPLPVYEAVEATLVERHYVPRSFNCCELFITIWNCGDHGILRADNEEIYRFGRNKEMLVLRNGHKIEGFYK